jgi:LysM repeat protein
MEEFPLARRISARSSVRRKAAAVGLSAAVMTGAFAGAANASTTYKVQQGDTLSSIAAKFGHSSWQALFSANSGINNPHLIYAGHNLVVPGKGDVKPTRTVTGTKSVSSKSVAKKSVKQHAKKAQVATSVTRSAARASSSGGNGVWDRLAMCESTGNWSANTGNGFYGGLQFTPSSWRAVGGSGMPHNASKAEQIARAKKLQQLQGWGAWPACSKKLGLR